MQTLLENCEWIVVNFLNKFDFPNFIETNCILEALIPFNFGVIILGFKKLLNWFLILHLFFVDHSHVVINFRQLLLFSYNFGRFFKTFQTFCILSCLIVKYGQIKIIGRDLFRAPIKNDLHHSYIMQITLLSVFSHA